MTQILTSGRVWKFGDNIDTDLMLPGSHVWGTQEERARVVFRANRPGWADEVKKGDAIVAGKNFGTGSSRPAALSLKLCGVRLLVAETINSLFFRNAVNYGLPAFECRGVMDAFEEGDGIEVSVADWSVTNLRTGNKLAVNPVHEMPLRLMLGGGIVPMLEGRGLIAKAAKEPTTSLSA